MGILKLEILLFLLGAYKHSLSVFKFLKRIFYENHILKESSFYYLYHFVINIFNFNVIVIIIDIIIGNHFLFY